MVAKDLCGKIAIVGASETDRLGELPNHSMVTLHAEGIRNALSDAGLKLSDVDGLFCPGIAMTQLGEYLGIAPRVYNNSQMGGCSFIAMVEHAMLALAAGIINVAVISHGESGRSRVGVASFPSGPSLPGGQFETPYGTFGAPTTFSLPATRHMHQYGTTQEQMAQVSVSTRKWAQMHPKAVMKDDLTVEDVMNSRVVCWPYTLLMCCLVTDAGGALVLTRADESRALPKPPVYVLGTGHATAHYNIMNMRDATTSDAAVISGRSAFDMSGLSQNDIDVAELYDAFSFTPMAALEDLGFVAKGESGGFVENGRTAPGGEFPMNTNGGGLSYSHSGMYGMYTMIELVRQLRGEAGKRQVRDAKFGIAHGPGGMFAAASTLIAGAEVP